MRSELQRHEGKKALLGPFLCWLYGRGFRTIRVLVRSILERIEGGELYSLTLRDIMRKYHGVEIGLYTMGAPFVPSSFPPGTKIGRFCSIMWTACAFNVDHPMNLKSSHAFFFNPALGLVSHDPRIRPPLTIGNDVLIGHNAIILPSVRTIGDGAWIGAGTVVHQNVLPYAVVLGHPGRMVCYRFEEDVITDLLASRWWDKPLTEIAQNLEEFRRPLRKSILDKSP
jgi:acetyltransferase-like isoleucine patch superfamily enzyme